MRRENSFTLYIQLTLFYEEEKKQSHLTFKFMKEKKTLSLNHRVLFLHTLLSSVCNKPRARKSEWVKESEWVSRREGERRNLFKSLFFCSNDRLFMLWHFIRLLLHINRLRRWQRAFKKVKLGFIKLLETSNNVRRNNDPLSRRRRIETSFFWQISLRSSVASSSISSRLPDLIRES